MKINLRDFLTTFALSLFIFLNIMTANAQTASFSYQGKLTDGALAANGTYQMQFGLFDTATGGSQIGATQTSSVTVANGIFTVNLGFGAAAFDGTDRFLQISVFSTVANAFVVLTPRQQITSAPYAIRSTNATTADNALNLGGTSANQYVLTNDPRMTDSRDPKPGSNFYIRTDNSLQAADIYISGAMTANGFDSNSGYLIGGGTVLSAPGTNNLFVGLGAGASTTTGGNNSFVGTETGQGNATGNFNSFFGRSAGAANTSGSNNSLLGSNSNFGSGNLSFATAIGANSVVTTSNTIVFGRNLGQDTVQIPGILNVANQYNLGGSRVLSVAGTDNLFVGESTGAANTTGNSNTFVGRSAGLNNLTASSNSFFGTAAGLTTSTGGSNSFFGRSAGQLNSTGFDNSFFGRSAGISNTTGDNNSFFGRSTGAANLDGTFNSFFGSLTGDSNTSGSNNTFVGGAAGSANTSGNSNTFVGLQAGEGSTNGDGNSFFGVNSGNTNTTGSFNTYLGYNAKGAAGITNATAIGYNAFVFQSNQIVLGTDTNFVIIPGNLRTMGTTIADVLRINTLGASGSLALCRNFLFEVATCSSSARYKTNIADFRSGLSIVNRLRPVAFNWKSDGSRDLGLVAEEVAAADELLIIRNQKGEVEGVKYDRVGVILINAVKEQQAQIESLNRQIEQLKKLVCAANPQAEACREQ